MNSLSMVVTYPSQSNGEKTLDDSMTPPPSSDFFRQASVILSRFKLHHGSFSAKSVAGGSSCGGLVSQPADRFYESASPCTKGRVRSMLQA
jgi:hypothetical protein